MYIYICIYIYIISNNWVKFSSGEALVTSYASLFRFEMTRFATGGSSQGPKVCPLSLEDILVNNG